jgi:hypothetical protein
MSVDGAGVSRRSFLKRTTAVSLGAIAARGIYGALDDMGLAGPERAFGQTPTARRTEQYLVSGLETLNDAGVTVLVPPIYTDMVTATLDAGRTWTKDELRRAQSRLELALRFVERPYRDNAAGLTIVVAWGLPYFRGRVRASVWEKYAPQDVALSAKLGRRELAVLDARTFPSDPAGGLRLEDNDVVFKFRSDSQSIVREAGCCELFELGLVVGGVVPPVGLLLARVAGPALRAGVDVRDAVLRVRVLRAGRALVAGRGSERS